MSFDVQQNGELQNWKKNPEKKVQIINIVITNTCKNISKEIFGGMEFIQ